MEQENTFSDLRVILLNKALDYQANIPRIKEIFYEGKTEMRTYSMSTTRWITLGHFDFVYCYPLPSDSDISALQLIGSHNIELPHAPLEADPADPTNQESRLYLRPIYIVKERSMEEKVAVNAFWDENTDYMFITRVYNSWNTKADIFEESVCKTIKCDADTKFLCYHTMELSDLVLVIKSSKISNILTILRDLYGSGYGGTSYSYCCINESAQPEDSDIIPYCSIRFSVKESHVANQVLARLLNVVDLQKKHQANIYVITGNDDLNLVLHDQSAKLLKTMIDALQTDHEIQRAFYSITTRLGIRIDKSVVPLNDEGNYKQLDKNLSPTDDCQLSQILFDLQNQISALQQVYRQNAKDYKCLHSWLHSLGLIIDSLVVMSQHSVTNEMCYLILDGLSAFCNCIGDPDVIEKTPVRFLQEFVSNLNSLMECILRIEGQLVHQPEMRPPLYDISPVTLELYLAYIWLCASLFADDDTAPDKHSFFLVPRLAQRIRITPLLEKSGGTTKDEKQLLQIEIPLHQLYQPNTIFFTLCHECSHFVGESTRCRDIRFKKFAEACACCVAVYLDLPYREVVNVLVNIIYDPSAIKSPLHFDEILRFSRATIRNFLTNQDTVVSLYDAAWPQVKLKMPEINKNDWYRSKGRELNNKFRAGLITVINDFTGELRELFRETYADLVMINTLNLEIDQYFNSFNSEVEHYAGQAGVLEPLVQRVAAVVSVAFDKGLDNLIEKQASALYEKLSEYGEYLSGKYNPVGSNYYLPPDVFGYISDYLRVCNEKLQEEFSTPEKHAQRVAIQELKNSIVEQDRLDGPAYRDAIQGYRKSLLKKLDELVTNSHL